MYWVRELFIQPTAFRFVILWEAYLGNIYPAPTKVSAISICISLAPLFAFGLVIPWEAYLGNIYPAPTEVSAISICISLAPLFAFGLVIPWEAYLGNIYTAPTEVSAISSCISAHFEPYSFWSVHKAIYVYLFIYGNIQGSHSISKVCW